MTPEIKKIPDWAQWERQSDLGWIAENRDAFWTVATTAFQDVGPGAIVVDTTVQPLPGSGHPFGYFSQGPIEQQAYEDTMRMVSEYDPQHEFAVVLLKAQDRISTYRMRAIGTEETDWDFWYLQDREAALAKATAAEMQLILAGAKQLEEGAPEAAQVLRDDAERIRQRLTEQEKTAELKLEPLDLETLVACESGPTHSFENVRIIQPDAIVLKQLALMLEKRPRR
jgi:hypothetical protein